MAVDAGHTLKVPPVAVHSPECSGQISDKAIICPHCGFPVRDGSIYTKEPKKKSLRLL